MAQNGLSRMILRRCHKENIKPLPTSRPFSHTRKHAQTIPRFSPSSTPELDDLFMTFRTKIFTPHALSQSHRDLIYKPTRHYLLTNDPGVTVTMSDNEELRLQPMTMLDRPPKKKSLQRLLDLLQESKDWQNLPAFLRGMQMAREKLPSGYMEKFVRRANERGMTGVIIRCTEMVKKTGMCLADAAVARELMLGIHFRAVSCGFQGEEMEKAVHQAREVALLMEKPDHCGVRKIGKEDMRKDLTVLGTILELQAARADQPEEETFTFGTLTKTAWKVMAAWPQLDLKVDDDAVAVRLQLERWLPLWAGLKLALQAKKMLGSELHGKLSEVHDALTKPVEQARTVVETASLGRSRRCLHMYNDVKDL